LLLLGTRLDEATGRIDYDALEKSAQLFRPKLIIAGASAYSRNIDYKRMRDIAGTPVRRTLSSMKHPTALLGGMPLVIGMGCIDPLLWRCLLHGSDVPCHGPFAKLHVEELAQKLAC
jgi:hypothetical protein